MYTDFGNIHSIMFPLQETEQMNRRTWRLSSRRSWHWEERRERRVRERTRKPSRFSRINKRRWFRRLYRHRQISQKSKWFYLSMVWHILVCIALIEKVGVWSIDFFSTAHLSKIGHLCWKPWSIQNEGWKSSSTWVKLDWPSLVLDGRKLSA